MSAHKTDLAHLHGSKENSPRHLTTKPAPETAHLQIDSEYQLYCEENSPRNLTAYPAIAS